MTLPTATAQALNETGIERACTRLVMDFAAFNDGREFDRLAGLFSEDGTFARPRSPDVVFSGQQDIRASFNDRPEGEVTRHLIQNLRITVTSSSQAQGHFYLVLYTATKDPHAGPFGPRAHDRQLVADIDDRFVLTPDGWRIAHRRGRMIMHAQR